MENPKVAKKFGPLIITDAKGQGVYAKTPGQAELVNVIEENDITFVSGPAGTGKSFLAMAKAVQYLQSGKYERIILTRPAVESGESLGFLPGELNDKIAPYMKPLYEFLGSFMQKEKAVSEAVHEISSKRNRKASKKLPKHEYEKAQHGKGGHSGPKETVNWSSQVEISPLAYMRGRTLDKAVVIMDEAQNVSIHQMKMFLTRMGQSSKFIITGDETQSDLNLRRSQKSGFDDALDRLYGIEGIGFMEMTEEDIVRHRLVRQIIRAYDVGRTE